MNSKPKVLILCNDFPPVNSIGAERPYSWYKYFHHSGYYPIIITKNWIPNNDAMIQKVQNKMNHDSKDTGELIGVRQRYVPSIWYQDKFQMKYSFIRKFLTLFEKTFCFHFGFLDQHYGIYKEAMKYIQNNRVECIITTCYFFR